MASREEFITLTTAAPSDRIAMDGPHRVDIVGTFGGGTVTESSFTETAGAGAAVRAGTAIAESYQSNNSYAQFDIAGSAGATVTIVLTPIVDLTRDA